MKPKVSLLETIKVTPLRSPTVDSDDYSPVGSGAIRVVAVSGRGLLRPPLVTTIRPEMIAAAGASKFSGIEPTTCQVFALGSNCSKSPTTFRGGLELLHRPPTIKIRPL
jgi:hypothetical protein